MNNIHVVLITLITSIVSAAIWGYGHHLAEITESPILMWISVAFLGIFQLAIAGAGVVAYSDSKDVK